MQQITGHRFHEWEITNMKDIFLKLLSCLRSKSIFYQHIHWTSKNVVSFQDHLLAERLYNAVEDEIDPVAEKAMGICKDPSVVDPNIITAMVAEKLKLVPMFGKENGEMFKSALTMEQEFIKYCTDYSKIPGVSLGVQNMLADMADHAEGRVYLLQQRITK